MIDQFDWVTGLCTIEALHFRVVRVLRGFLPGSAVVEV